MVAANETSKQERTEDVSAPLRRNSVSADKEFSSPPDQATGFSGELLNPTLCTDGLLGALPSKHVKLM